MVQKMYQEQQKIIVEKLVNGFSTFIDMIGGLPSVLLLVGEIFTKIYQQNIVTFFDNFSYNMKSRTQQLQAEMLSFRESTQQALSEMIPMGDSNAGAVALRNAYAGQSEVQSAYINKQQELLANKQKMSEFDKQEIESLMSITDIYTEKVKLVAQEYDKNEENLQLLNNQLNLQIKQAKVNMAPTNIKVAAYEKAKKDVEEYSRSMSALGKVLVELQKIEAQTKGVISEEDQKHLELYKAK